MVMDEIQHCMNLVRQHDYCRYIATLYLPQPQRDAAFVIYGFDAQISNIGTLVREPMAGEIRLQWWRDVVDGKGDSSGNPVAMALLKVIKQHNLPVALFQNLLDARIFDLYCDPMPDKNTFEGYLGETCSTLFRLVMLSAGSQTLVEKYPSPIAQACGHGGVYHGIVNLLSFLPEHEFRGKSYFPNDISRTVSIETVNTASAQKRVVSQWLADVCSYAQRHFDASSNSINQLPTELRTTFLPMAGQLVRLQKISASGINLSGENRQVSRLKIWWATRKAAKR